MYEQGIIAIAAENPDEAIIWFKKALQQNPEMALAHYKLGELYHSKGDDWRAYSELNRALQQNSKLKDARKALVFLLVQQRAIVQAVRACEEYLEVSGGDEEIYLVLANSLEYIKKIDEAIRVLEKARELYPENITLKISLARMLGQNGDIPQGRSIIEELAREKPNNFEVQWNLAFMYELLERFDLAVLTLEVLKKKFPENPSSYQSLARLSAMNNQPDKAKKILLEAEKAGIDDSGLYRLHAIISHRQRDSATALKYYTKAVGAANDDTRQANQMILVEYLTFLKKYEEAQKILETLIAEDSSNNKLRSKVVELFMAKGQFDQARVSVNNLVKEHPSDARGHFLKGLVMMQEKDINEARKEFSKVKEFAPNAAENQFLYGLTFVDESEQLAITEISEALKKNPNLLKARMVLAEVYFKKGDFQKSLDELDKILIRQKGNIKAMVLRISVFLKTNKFASALDEAQLLVDKEPEKPWHRFRLAEIYYNMDEYEKSLSLYEELQREKGDSVQLLDRIVGVYLSKNEDEKAMQTAESFLAKYPDNSTAVMIKARICLSQGDIDLAENVLLSEVDKSDDSALIVMLAELYRKKSDVQKAAYYFHKAQALVPDNMRISLKLANFYQTNGDYPAAIVSYEKVLEQEEDSLPAMNNLAYLYTEEGENLDRALELATAASAKLPGNPGVADTLGWIYVNKGLYSLANPYMQQAMTGHPDSPTIIYHMGMLRYGQRKQQEAQKLLTAAIEKGLCGRELRRANETLTIIVLLKEKLLAAKARKEQGDFGEAIGLYEKILQEEGFNVDAAANLAMLYAEQKQNISKALELAKQAYNTRLVSPQIADALGWVYYHQGSLLLAKQYLTQAIDNDAEYGPAHVHLAAMYLKEEKLQEAQKEITVAKSLKLSSGDSQRLEAMIQKLKEK